MNKILAIKEKIEDSIIVKIIKGFAYLLVILLLFVTIVQKVSNNSLSLGGYRVFMIVSRSMEDEYSVGNILIAKSVPEKDLKVGDDVTYLGKSGQVKGIIITHQIIKIEEENGVKYYTTKGIANEIADPRIKYDQIYGKIVYKTVILSFLGEFMTKPVAYYLIFITIALIFCVEIVSYIFNNRNDDDDEEDDDEEEEPVESEETTSEEEKIEVENTETNSETPQVEESKDDDANG